MPAPQGTRAVVLLADYIAVDAAGKVNAIGTGFTVTGSNAGVSPAQYVAALIDLPASSAGDQIPVSLELRDETTDQLVTVPDAATHRPTALRIQQLAVVQRLQLPGVHLPADLPCRVQVVLAFPGGLPLAPGHKYAWKLEVDGTRFKGWSAHFYVAAPPPGPVIGGPAGPSSIPNIQMPPMEQDDEPDGPSGAVPE